MRPLDRERHRQWTRRPIDPTEAPLLEDLGREVEALRRRYGVSRVAVADAAYLGCSALYRIEKGLRRTRASTLRRIVEGLFEHLDPADQAVLDVDGTVARLVAIAGPALAPESPHRERIERRMVRRQERRREQREMESQWWQ